MTIAEIIKLNETTLRILDKEGITTRFVHHYAMYKEYMMLEHQGYKLTYVYAYLSERYNIAERNVKVIISRFKKEVEYDAIASCRNS